MKLGGRVLLRSAGLRPWYIRVFEEEGFKAKQVMARHPGAYIDRYILVFSFNSLLARMSLSNDWINRVNMYASTWVCTKLERLSSGRRESSSSEVDMLEI
jgi:betaine lipid synthase